MERKSVDDKLKRKPSGAAVMRAELTNTLFRALFEEWAITGYTGISLERVATRAGAGKAAIYRRWPSKKAFASDAIEAAGVALTDLPDHGSLAADLTALLRMLRRTIRHRLVRRILPDLHAEQARSSELDSALDRLANFRRRQGDLLLDRAVGRRELPRSLDRELALDLIPSSLYWRMIVLNRRATNEYIARQAALLIAALKAET